MVKNFPLEHRVTMMKDNDSVTASEIEEYKRTEIIRRAMADVKVRAAADAKRRQDPKKTYSAVKSKISINLKSQKKAKKI